MDKIYLFTNKYLKDSLSIYDTSNITVPSLSIVSIVKIIILFYIQNQGLKCLLYFADFTLYDYAHSSVLRSHRAKTGRLKKGEANAFHAQGLFRCSTITTHLYLSVF